jgi:hypothetical protein
LGDIELVDKYSNHPKGKENSDKSNKMLNDDKEIISDNSLREDIEIKVEKDSELVGNISEYNEEEYVHKTGTDFLKCQDIIKDVLLNYENVDVQKEIKVEVENSSIMEDASQTMVEFQEYQEIMMDDFLKYEDVKKEIKVEETLKENVEEFYMHENQTDYNILGPENVLLENKELKKQSNKNLLLHDKFTGSESESNIKRLKVSPSDSAPLIDSSRESDSNCNSCSNITYSLKHEHFSTMEDKKK